LNKNITPQLFSITQISHHGTSNPILARLFFQMVELFKLTKFSESEREEINKNLLNLAHVLLRSYDIHQNFEKSFDDEINKIKPFIPETRAYYNPYINNLDGSVENFLYQSKNFLRDLGHFLKFFYPNFKFSETPFSSKKQKNNIFDNLFSVLKPELNSVFQEDKKWIDELISKRNAVEHPNGYNGQLKIINFQTIPPQNIIPPIWYREKDNKKLSPITDIRQDLTMYLGNLLTFSEEIIINFCIEENFFIKKINICEIPENERDKTCPIRFTTTLV